jgi:hypothetical protein
LAVAGDDEFGEGGEGILVIRHQDRG